MTIEKEEYLQDVLATHRMAHIDDLLNKYKSKRLEIKEAIDEKYGKDAYSPLNSGSYAKHTAINIKFDLDIVVPFKKNSFDTLEEMFNDLFEFLNDKYNKEGIIRKQKVSIGIEFNPDKDGDIIYLDVVPGRELNQNQYLDDRNINLFVYSKYGIIAEMSYLQTNIQAQIEHIRNTGDQKNSIRQIIRLLKIWKFNKSEKYKSFLLELITIKAFDKEDISGNLWEKLKKVMEYLKDNINKENYKLTDPGNSNNNVVDTLEFWERSNLASRMETIINRIEENSENIKYYFPKNEKFEQKESNQNTYGIKSAIIAPSVPPNNQRFGKCH